VVLAFLTASVLTGRRKILIIVATFVAMYFALLYYYRHRSGRRTLLLVCVLSASFVVGALYMAPAGSPLRPYIDRGQSVFGGAGERFTDLGLASVAWAFNRGGFFGLGAGAGSQGTQHFFEGGEVIAGGAAEGGLGKVAVELGIPGLILVVLTLILVARNVWRTLNFISVRDAKLLPLCAGMVAFCAANVPVFIGASQIYGDPFVLMLLGCFLGFVLAVARLQQPVAYSAP
jgi:O-antigen ligase